MPKQPPRVNVVVTPEQHALLLEFAKLDPSTRSASSFMRDLLDRVTPLLRELVPVMRLASREKEQAGEQVRGAIDLLTQQLKQLDMLASTSPGRSVPSASEGAPPRRRAARK